MKWRTADRHFQSTSGISSIGGQNTRVFDAMAQYITLPANLTSGGPAAQISATQASGSLFEVLRESAALGRTFAADDDRPSSPGVAMIGDGLWRQRFGGTPDVLGTAIVIDGTSYTVVGVLAPGFRLPEGQRLRADVEAVIPMRIEVGWVGDHNNSAIGRLAGRRHDRAGAGGDRRAPAPGGGERDGAVGPDGDAHGRGAAADRCDCRPRAPQRAPVVWRDRRRARDRLFEPDEPGADPRAGTDARRGDPIGTWRGQGPPAGARAARLWVAGRDRRRHRRVDRVRRAARLRPDGASGSAAGRGRDARRPRARLRRARDRCHRPAGVDPAGAAHWRSRSAGVAAQRLRFRGARACRIARAHRADGRAGRARGNAPDSNGASRHEPAARARHRPRLQRRRCAVGAGRAARRPLPRRSHAHRCDRAHPRGCEGAAWRSRRVVDIVVADAWGRPGQLRPGRRHQRPACGAAKRELPLHRA